MTKDEQWLLEEKYNGEQSAPVFNESLDEIKNKYPWGEGFFTDCQRLAAGEPLGYVIGHVPFLGCTIYVTSEIEQTPPSAYSHAHNSDSSSKTGIKAKQFTLIPRAETEWWVEQAIGVIQADAAALPPRILDLCAGSGAIGVAVAHALPETRVDFAEIDPRLLPTIEKNCRENDINDERYKIIQSDLFTAITGTYDFILSNPPYIDPELDRTQSSVKNFEPHLALYGGADGMELIADIISKAPSFLALYGQLWIEHEPEQSDAIASLATSHGFTATTHMDQFTVQRYSVLMLE